VPNAINQVVDALLAVGMCETAGDLLEHLGTHDRAVDAYRRGHAFRKALDVCRAFFAGQVAAVEEEWGEHLAKQKQVFAALLGCCYRAVAHAVQLGMRVMPL